MRPRLFLVLVSALVVALAGLSPSPAAGSTLTEGGLADQWADMTEQERAFAWSMAGLQEPADDPAITAVAPGAGPFDSAGPGIVRIGRVSTTMASPFVEPWEGLVPGGTWFAPATGEFFTTGSANVVHLVFDDPVDQCGTGQVEVALFEDVAGTTRFPGFDGFTTPDRTSTRAPVHLCRGGQNQWLYFTGDQPGQPFAGAHGGLHFTGPAPGVSGDRQQLIVITENPNAVVLPTITVAENPADPLTYRWRQWDGPTAQPVDLDTPPEVDAATEVAILTLLGRPLPAGADTDADANADADADGTEGADTEDAGQEGSGQGDDGAGPETDSTETVDTGSDTDAEEQVAAAAGADGDDEEPEAQEIDDTTAILDEPDDGGNGLLLGLLGLGVLLLMILGFLLRNILFGWLRSDPGPSPDGRPHSDEPMPDQDKQLDQFLNLLVNTSLDQGRRPDGDRRLEFTEDQLDEVLNEYPMARELFERRDVHLGEAIGKRLVVHVDTFEATVRTYETEAVATN